MRIPVRTSLGLAAIIAAIAIADTAEGGVTIIGAGLASSCSTAAKSGRSDRAAEKLCTQALEETVLTPHDRAATLVNRGVLKLRRKNWVEATADFESAVRLEPRLG